MATEMSMAFIRLLVIQATAATALLPHGRLFQQWQPIAAPALRTLHASRSNAKMAAPSEARRQTQQLALVFTAFSTDDGLIDAVQLRRALSSLGREVDGRASSNLIRTLLNTNDGKIDESQFASLVSKMVPRDVERIFDSYDTDDSGGLDEGELLDALRELGRDIQSKAARELLAAYDGNRSGQLELLQFASLVAQLAPAAVVAAFEEFEGGTGGLSADELRLALLKLDRDVASDYAANLLREYDSNQSDQLELLQFSALVSSLVPADVWDAFSMRCDPETGLLSVNKLRGVMRDLGVDLKSEQVSVLLDYYDADNDGDLGLLGFADLVKLTPIAQIWLAVDPSGKLRASRRGLIKVVSAGQASWTRKIHSLVGVASLCLGLQLIVEDVSHLGTGTQSQVELTTAAAVSVVHVLTGIFGLPRINWKEGVEPVRRALFVVVPFQNTWFALALATEYTTPAASVADVLHVQGPLFLGYSFLMAGVMVWLTSINARPGGAVDPKSGLFYDAAASNLLAIAPYAFFYCAFLTQLLSLGLRPGALDSYLQFVGDYPAYLDLMRGQFLSFMWLNNVLPFVATLIPYGALSVQGAGIFYAVLMAVTLAVPYQTYYGLTAAGLLPPGLELGLFTVLS